MTNADPAGRIGQDQQYGRDVRAPLAGSDGTLSALGDGKSLSMVTGVDNSTDPLAPIDIGERDPSNFNLAVDGSASGRASASRAVRASGIVRRMVPEEIESAYITFVRELRDGDFDPPGDGWSAEHIAAHVALNNDIFAAAVRDVLAGGPAGYDNRSAVDIDLLTAYASKFADLGDLADDVARSATDLSVAYAELVTAEADTEIPIVIHHDGHIVRDGPGPLAELIEGNATYHLSMHLDQLLALRPSR